MISFFLKLLLNSIHVFRPHELNNTSFSGSLRTLDVTKSLKEFSDPSISQIFLSMFPQLEVLYISQKNKTSYGSIESIIQEIKKSGYQKINSTSNRQITVEDSKLAIMNWSPISAKPPSDESPLPILEELKAIKPYSTNFKIDPE